MAKARWGSRGPPAALPVQKPVSSAWRGTGARVRLGDTRIRHRRCAKSCLGHRKLEGGLHRRLVSVLFYFSNLGTLLPRPPWVVGYLLVMRGQQAAICGPTGRAKDLKGWGWWGHPSPPFSSWQPSTTAIVYVLKGPPLYSAQRDLGPVLSSSQNSRTDFQK